MKFVALRTQSIEEEGLLLQRVCGAVIALVLITLSFNVRAAVQQCPFAVAPPIVATLTVDGLVHARYALGLRGSALTDGVTAAGQLSAAESAIAGARIQLDVDGDGAFTPVDAGIIARYLAGLNPEAWLTGLKLANNAKRKTGAEIASFLSAGCPPNAVVAAGHPRVFLTPSRIAEIQSALQQPTLQPLSGAAFPQATGTIELDIRPSLNAAYPPTGCGVPYVCKAVFDDYDSTRNHLFIRESYDTTSPPPAGSTTYQITLQRANSSSYAAVFVVTLAAGEWHTLRVSWNANTASFALNGSAPAVRTLATPWVPSEQSFELSGRDALDNVRLYSSDSKTAGSMIAQFRFDEGSGEAAVDDVGGRTLSLSNWVHWSDGLGASSSVSALQFGVPAGSIGARVLPPSLLIDAWFASKGLADGFAATLLAGGSPANVASGHPDVIVQVARHLAMGYRVSGSANYLDASLRYADQLIAVLPESGGEYTQAGRVEAMGTLYDWLFEALGATLHAPSGTTYRAKLGETIRATLRVSDGVWAQVCGSDDAMAPTTGWKCKSTLNGGKSYARSIAGHDVEDRASVLAGVLAIIDEYPDMGELLAQIYEHDFGKDAEYAFRDWINADGGSQMGWGYAAGYVEHESVKLWATATNVQMPDTWQSRQVLRNIYGQRGDLSFPASGDSFAVDALNYTMLPSVLWSAAGTTPVAPYARRYYKTVLRPNTPVRSFDRINELLYWQAGASEAPLETLPLAVAFRPSGQVLMRDVWDYSRATLLEFKSTAFWNEAHHHLDQNAFTLFYKAPLLVDSGRYDAYASTHWQNYYTRTIAHNTMTVWDQAEAFVKYPGSNPAFPLLTNDGGQRVIAARDANGATRDSPYYPYLEDIRPSGSAALDGVALFDAQGDYMYVVGNASKAYSAAKLDQSAGFLRSIVFLPSPSFWPKPVTLVFDRVRATAAAAGLTKRFLLHTVNEPEPFGGTPLQAGVRQIAGDVLTIRNGAGMLFSQTLLPSNPRIIKVGDSTSQNFRFLVPAAGSVDYMSGLTNFPPLTDPNSGAAAVDVGAWRVEISAPSASAQEYFLHVISVADNDGSVASPPTVVNHSNGDAAVAAFSNGMTVAFAKSNAEATTIAWKCASAPSSLLVAGVQPNVHYDAYTEVSGDTSLPTRVVIAASTTGAYTSTAQGVLRIDATLPAR